MQLTITKLCMAAAALIVNVAHADGPLTFKGFGLGAEQASFVAAFPANPSIPCIDVCLWRPSKDCNVWNHDCLNGFYYGGVLPITIMARFKDKKLVSVHLTFDSEQFENLADAMMERFQKPETDERQIVQNRMGARFDNRVIRWQRNDGYLILKKRDETIDEGSVLLISMQYARETGQQLENAVKSRAKSL